MLNRREWIGITAGAGAALALHPHLLRALQQGQLLQRAVPSTGEMLPVIGLGSSATFSQAARAEEIETLSAVIRTMIDQGARVFDTAPSYGASEQVAGDIANTLGVADRIFWAGRGCAPRPARVRDPKGYQPLEDDQYDIPAFLRRGSPGDGRSG